MGGVSHVTYEHLYYGVYGHFGIKTLRHQCRSVSDISAPITEVYRACQRRQLRSGRGGEIKAVDVYVPLSLNCGFWSQLSGATVRSQLLWRMLRVIIITVMSLSYRLHGARVHHPSVCNRCTLIGGYRPLWFQHCTTLFFFSLAIYNCVAYMDYDKSVFVPLYFFPITSHKRTLYKKQRVL